MLIIFSKYVDCKNSPQCLLSWTNASIILTSPLLAVSMQETQKQAWGSAFLSLVLFLAESFTRRTFWKSTLQFSSKPSFLNFGLVFICPSISTYNRPGPTRFYFLGLASGFKVFLSADLQLVDQALPRGHGSRCLFNFCPQHFKTISQDLDRGQ